MTDALVHDLQHLVDSLEDEILALSRAFETELRGPRPQLELVHGGAGEEGS